MCTHPQTSCPSFPLYLLQLQTLCLCLLWLWPQPIQLSHNHTTFITTYPNVVEGTCPFSRRFTHLYHQRQFFIHISQTYDLKRPPDHISLFSAFLCCIWLGIQVHRLLGDDHGGYFTFDPWELLDFQVKNHLMSEQQDTLTDWHVIPCLQPHGDIFMQLKCEAIQWKICLCNGHAF